MEFCSKIRKLDFGQITITICIVILATWCSYNVSHIWQKYWKFETIISLHNDPPNRTEFPGITICAPTIFTTEKLAELFPDFHTEMENITRGLRPESWAFQLGLNIDDDQYWRLIRARHELFERYESKALLRFSAIEVITKYSVRIEEIVDECHFKAYNIRNFQVENNDLFYYDCHEIQPVLESVYENKKCFTYFSTINPKNKDSPTKYTGNKTDSEDDNEDADESKNDTTPIPPMTESEKRVKKILATLKHLKNGTVLIKTHRSNVPFTDFCAEGVCQIYSNYSEYFEAAAKEMIFDMNPSIELRIKSLDNTVWSMFTGDNTIVMTVHPPNILQNRRDFLFIQVTKNNNYEISFTKKTTLLMEPPYKTNCAKYDDPDHKQKFNGDEIKTRDECITTCIKQISHSQTSCIQYFSVLIKRMFRREEHDLESKICDHVNQNYTMFLESRKKCETLCRAECCKSIFEISGRVLTQLDDQCSNPPLPVKNPLIDGDGDDPDDPDLNYDYLNWKPAEETNGFYTNKHFSATPGRVEATSRPTKSLSAASRHEASTKQFSYRKVAESNRLRKKHSKLDDVTRENLYAAQHRIKDRKLEHFGTPTSQWMKKPKSTEMNAKEYKAMHHPEHPNLRQKRSATDAYQEYQPTPNPGHCNARVSIRISPKPFTTVAHQPAVSFEGFLGTIGGHIGIWLGLSLYKIIKFLVHIIYSMIHNFFDLCR